MWSAMKESILFKLNIIIKFSCIDPPTTYCTGLAIKQPAGKYRGVRFKSKIPDYERGRRIVDPAVVRGRSAN